MRKLRICNLRAHPQEGSRNLQEDLGIGDDCSFGRDELDCKFGLTARAIG
jgi:hypothetical protein